MTRRVLYATFAALALPQAHVAQAGHGCDKDHFAIGQLGGEGSHTGQLFADVEELYTVHDDDPCTKPFASHYPLNPSGSWYVNTEPGTEAIENDLEHELAGTRTVDYDIYLEIVHIPEGLYIERDGVYYSEPGGRIRLSDAPWHHLHMKYWWYYTYHAEGKMIYVVYRLVDVLEDGQQYTASDDFWIVFNAPVPGDFNADSHIDQDDLQHFVTCATGPAVPQEDPLCQDADLDADGDVDQSDFGLLQRCFTGPDNHSDPRCAE